MKSKIILSATAFALLGASSLNAQTVVHESSTSVEPTEVAGTVTEFVPDAIVVRSSETAAPVRYTYTKSTEYVDEDGNRVSQEVVKSGAPVTIRYVKEGDRMVVRRVIVRRHTTSTAVPDDSVTTKKTTTTTTE